MASEAKQYAAKLAAQVAVAKLQQRNQLGVLIENLPAIDPQTFATELGRTIARPVRLAVLGGESKPRAPQNVALTTSPTEANVWRNDLEASGGTPLVVLVLGPAAKLNSLRTTVSPLLPEEFRQALVTETIQLLDTPERQAFWSALQGLQDEVGLAALVRFAVAVVDSSTASRATLIDQEWKLTYLLGLIPDDRLFHSAGERSARTEIKKNLEFVRRLRALSSTARKRLVKILEGTDESDPANRLATAVLKFEKKGAKELLKDLKLKDVQDLLKGGGASAPIKEGGERDAPQTKDRIQGDALALEMVLNEDRGIKAAAERFRRAIEPDDDGGIQPDDIVVNRRDIVPRVKIGTAQAAVLFGELLSTSVWGGFVEAPDAADHVGALKLLASGHVEVVPFRPEADGNLVEMLRRAVNQGVTDTKVLSSWEEYATARTKLLKHGPALSDHPMLALAGSHEVRTGARELVRAYGEFLSYLRAAADELRRAGSIEPAKRLFAYVLCLDAAFIRTRDEFVGVAAPTHPFHLWRWLALLDLLEDNKSELLDIGLDILEPLVTDPPAVAPDLLLSPFAVGPQLAKAYPFVPIGSFGALPLFGEPSARQAAKFRARSLGKIAKRFIRLMPHASFGLRVLLVDPPSIAGALEDLLDLPDAFDGDYAVPLHIVVTRTRAGREATDEEDHEIEGLAREVRDVGGTLTLLPPRRTLQEVVDQLADAAPHICVVFDPGQAQEIRIGITSPPALTPLMVPRAYRYDAFDDRLDVIIAGEGPFTNYHDIFCEAIDVPRSDFIGRRSGASRFARDLEALAVGSIWLVIADQGIEPTLRINGTIRLDSQSEAGRDIVTFTAHHETVEDLVADAVRVAGLKPTEETVKRTLHQILQLNGEALLALAKPRPDISLADRRVAKGILGIVAAARWYSETYPDSILISLDDPVSRRWILGSNDDNRQGDLLGLRLTANGVVVESVEVKAHDDASGAIRERNGIIEGKAAIQVDQTIKILKRVLSRENRRAIDTAKADVLRDQLYRAVASRQYTSDQRARFVQMLEDLFSVGPQQIVGLIFSVELLSGVSPISPSAPAQAKTSAGNLVGLVQLTESDALPLPSAGSLPRAEKVAEVAQLEATTQQEETPRKDDVAETKTLGSVPRNSAPPDGSTTQKPLRILIGTTGTNEEVVWEPARPDTPLNNFGLLVTGDSGTGKTQVLRAVISEVARSGFPVCAFDFKNDYAVSSFSTPEGLRVFDIDRDGLPFNPLALVGDHRGEAQPVRLIHELTSILRRIFSLGDQQEARLKKAMRQAFDSRGIASEKRHVVETAPPAPSFADVVAILSADDKNEALINRVSPLFDLNLFPASDAVSATFHELLSESVVLDLHGLPDDKIKAALAEFIIVRLHGHLLKGDQPRHFRRLLVFDEAWRVRSSERLEELAREGRAFGVGIAIGTQFPGDIPENLAGNLASQILLQNSDSDHRKSVARTLTGASSGPAATQVIRQIDRLQKHEGFFRNQHYTPYVLVKTEPHYRRKPRTG